MNPDTHYRSLEKMYLADSVVYDGREREIGRGNGLFVRGKIRLSEVRGYGDR